MTQGKFGRREGKKSHDATKTKYRMVCVPKQSSGAQEKKKRRGRETKAAKKIRKSEARDKIKFVGWSATKEKLRKQFGRRRKQTTQTATGEKEKSDVLWGEKSEETKWAEEQRAITGDSA